MIKIAGSPMDMSIADQYAPDSTERKIINILSSSSEVYRYDSESQLKFELAVRRSTVNAAYNLSRSRMAFRVFRKSKCNPDYWHRTNEGGFELLSGVKPSAAINDIFINSSYYGTECSTAIIIVFYKALVDVLPEELFNKLFPEIYLMNWQHLDRDLGINTYRNQTDYLPGDCRYFKNPDVDPTSPEWQGENVIVMNNGLYYGHGVGITKGDRIIEALNRKRISGSQVSAYLMDNANRLGFRSLAAQYEKFMLSAAPV